MQIHTIVENEEKRNLAKPTEQFENEPLIILFLSMGVAPVSIVIKAGKLFYEFIAEEVRDLKLQMLSSQDIMIPYKQLLYAQKSWKSALSIMREKRSA